MHLSVNNHDTSTNILSIKEIVAIIVVFSFVLYLLFPKDNIDTLLEENGENTNLSINYLESMLLYYPDNVKLKMTLVKNYDYAGKTDKALYLNQQIINENSDRDLLIELYKTQYLLEKDNYFKTGNAYLLTRLKERLLDYYEYTKEQRDYLFLFAESTNIDYTYLKYHSLIGLMQKQPELIDYEFEKQAYYLASTLHYEKKAYERLISLLNYSQIEEALQNHALSSLIMHKEFKKASQIAHTLFLNSYNSDASTKFFHIALYALGKEKNREEGAIRKLIQDYIESKEINTNDVYTILSTLLQEGRIEEASSHALSLFYNNAKNFDEKNIELAVNALTYDSKLLEARELTTYAKEHFLQQKYLDKEIQLSIWLSDIKSVNLLYQEGYEQYADSKYETYLLEKATLDDSYMILGEIYRAKIEEKRYNFIEKLSEYYNYTGELDEAENYFNKLLKTVKSSKIHAAAIHFTLDNSHFEKAFKLYEEYQSHYPLNKTLHEKVIKRLIAAKHFTHAYKLTKILKEHNNLNEERLFTDLSWIQKDYSYLHKALWFSQKQNHLNSTGYEHLLLLEKTINGEEKLNYLYKEAWEKTRNDYYFTALIYKELEKNNLSGIKHLLEKLSISEKKIFNNNIDYQILLSSYYAKTVNMPLALKAFQKALKIDPLRAGTHESYLWFLIDNQSQYKSLKSNISNELKTLQQQATLQKAVGIVSVVAAMYVKKNKLAIRWSREFIKHNPHNKEYKELYKEVLVTQRTKLYDSYDKMLNNAYLKGEVSLKQQHLTHKLSTKENSFSYEWSIHKNIKSKIKINQYVYKTKNNSTKKEYLFELALKNSQERFFWGLTLGKHKTNKDYFSSRINLGYAFPNLQFNIDTKYQNKTELTPALQKNALENSLAFSLQNSISNRISLGFLYKKSEYKTNQGKHLGKAQQIQLNANYILRSGYPDITFNGYLSHNRLSDSISKNFSELGIAMSIGTARQNTLNKDWKPFGTVGVAINNQRNIGASLSLGVSKTVQKTDSIDLLLNYSNGIGVISEPVYGVNVKYRF